jgi:hypothetical protein
MEKQTLIPDRIFIGRGAPIVKMLMTMAAPEPLNRRFQAIALLMRVPELH